MNIPTFIFVDSATGKTIDDPKELLDHPDRKFKVIEVEPTE